MSIIGNVNGWPLLAMPPKPGPRTVDWNARDIVTASTGAFTAKQQVQNWQASLLSATVTMPKMQRPLAAAWLAFLLQSQGQNAVFYFGDGLGGMPQGTAEGSGVTAGSFQGGYQLITTGWTPNQPMVLLPGDWLQVGWRIYMCLDMAAADGQGNSSFAIYPQIREIPAAGTPIITTNAQGAFRMVSNARQWSTDYMRLYGLSFQIREAI